MRHQLSNIELLLEMLHHIPENNGCLEWPRCTDGFGYGRLGTCTAHRLAFRAAYGISREDVCVLHKCDNPGCFRPDHLFLGTPADNVADMIAKGRVVKTSGERNRHARLTAEDVREIRRLRADGVLAKAIAEKYGIHVDTVYGISCPKSTRWNHLK